MFSTPLPFAGILTLRRWHVAEWLTAITLVGTFGLAALLRFERLDLVQFGGDEASTLTLAASFAESGVPPLVDAVSDSLGISPPGTISQILALPMLIRRDAEVGTAFIGLINLLGMATTFWFVRRYFGVRTALIVALLWAGDFSQVWHSRRVADLSFLVPLAPIFLTLTALWAIESKSWALSGAIICYVFAIALHLSALPWILILPVAWFAFRPKIRWGALLLGVGLAFFTQLPYLYYQVTNNFVDFRRLLSWAGSPAVVDFEALLAAATWLRWEANPSALVLPPDGALLEASRIGNLGALATVGFASGLVFLVYKARGILFSGQETLSSNVRASFLLCLFPLAPMLFFSRHAYPIAPHYFISLLPWLTIVSGIGLVFLADLAFGILCLWPAIGSKRLLRKEPLLSTSLSYGLALLPVAGHMVLFSALLNWADTQGSTLGFGPPLRYPREAVRAAQDLAAQTGSALIGPFQLEFREVFTFLADPSGGKALNSPYSAVIPEEGLKPTVFLVHSQPSPIEQLFRERFSPYLNHLYRQPSGLLTYRLYAYPGGKETLDYLTRGLRPLNVEFSDSTKFSGFELRRSAEYLEQADLTLLWQPGAPSEGKSLRLFLHLLNAAGKEVAGMDSLAVSSPDWGPTDLVISQVPLTLSAHTPAEVYSVEAGIFDAQTLERVPLRAAQGAATVRLGRVRLGEEPPQALPVNLRPTNVTLGEQIRLTGFTLPQNQVRPGAALRVGLLWEATKPLDKDYTTFVHIIDSLGRLVVQDDTQPQQGAYPTSIWDPGKTVVDEHLMRLPPTVPPGSYAVKVGIYELPSVARLPVRTETGAIGEDAITLGSIDVGE